MLPSSGSVKKPTICRYYSSSGHCIYGQDCKYLHSTVGAAAAELGNSELDKRYSSDTQQMAFRQTGDYANGAPDVGDMQPFHFHGGMQQPPRPGPIRGAAASSSLAPGAPFAPDDHGIQAMSYARTPSRGPLPFFSPMSVNPSANEFVPRMAQPTLAHGYSYPSITSDQLAQSRQQHLSSYVPEAAPGYQMHPGATMSPHGSPHVQRRSRSPMPSYDAQQRGNLEDAGTIQEYVGGTTYFYKPNEFDMNHSQQAYASYTVYPGVPSYIAHMKPKDNGQNSFFMPDELKMEILSKQMDVLSVIDSQTAGLPEEVDHYRHLASLELPALRKPSATLMYVTSCYKAVSTKDSLTYCLRRVQGFKLTNTKCMNVIDNWKKMLHSNIVGFREVFTTKAFGDNSIIFVYDYYPKATTLLQKHFGSEASTAANGYSAAPARPFGGGTGMASQRPAAAAAGGSYLPENLIWSYVVQLSNALRAVHAAGLACQLVDLSKILHTDKGRLRLNCVGMKDVLTTQGSASTPVNVVGLQQQDLSSFGKLVLCLACNSLTAANADQLKFSVEILSRTYSVDLHNLIVCMIGQRLHSINDIMPMIGARFYAQLDQVQMHCDVVEHELSKEVENGRLFRLLCKLGSVNERPEYAMDPQWSETGDRYMLKLYRDYLFHQVDETGAPHIDLSHVVSSLNKLDAGVSEKVQLSSRDEQNVIIVTYAELKRCFEAAFGELLQASSSSSGAAKTDDGQPRPHA